MFLYIFSATLAGISWAREYTLGAVANISMFILFQPYWSITFESEYTKFKNPREPTPVFLTREEPEELGPERVLDDPLIESDISEESSDDESFHSDDSGDFKTSVSVPKEPVSRSRRATANYNKKYVETLKDTDDEEEGDDKREGEKSGDVDDAAVET